MTTSAPPDRFEHEGWHVTLQLTRVGHDATSGFADVHEGGRHRCRLVLAAPQTDRVQLLERLSAKAIAYVDGCSALRRARAGAAPAAAAASASLSFTDLACLVYASRAPTLLEGDVRAILASSRRNNPARDVTGALCFLDGVYMQYLEGTQIAVDLLYRQIEVDKRHFMPKVLVRQALDARAFTDWSMAILRWTDETRGAVAAHGRHALPDLYDVDAANAVPLFKALTKVRGWSSL